MLATFWCCCYVVDEMFHVCFIIQLQLLLFVYLAFSMWLCLILLNLARWSKNHLLLSKTPLLQKWTTYKTSKNGRSPISFSMGHPCCLSIILVLISFLALWCMECLTWWSCCHEKLQCSLKKEKEKNQENSVYSYCLDKMFSIFSKTKYHYYKFICYHVWDFLNQNWKQMKVYNNLFLMQKESWTSKFPPTFIITCVVGP